MSPTAKVKRNGGGLKAGIAGSLKATSEDNEISIRNDVATPKAKVNEKGNDKPKKPRTQKANTPKSRKSKGRVLQQAVRDLLISKLGIAPADILSRSMGACGADLVLSSEARRRFPYAVECKCQENLSVWSALEQAKVNATKEGLRPLLTFKRNHSEIYVALTLQDFINLVKEVHNV